MHLAVEINTHKIITAGLSALNVTDGEMLPNLLKHTPPKNQCNIK
ncbi:hypothetical protein [Candidatus Enterovibrio altilux]|uniref:Mobile element protein n=1 Tax=Candidatus Enterovibrio altilux TaxID=1927128 RepID=A0A291B7W3_9GAMM|nr:hypothetical protein [Candidatus Enterovibrio luxaltus]ATF09057.1 hypothetical protein BTN50_0530 [Candidatus Enterovibrio luxaltus]